LEQVHVRVFFRRGLRLELVAALGLALAMPALTVAAAHAQTPDAQITDTQTTLTAEARDKGGRTQVAVAITVTGADGLAASGAVSIFDHSTQLAGVALDAQGQAKAVLDLDGGTHLLHAVFAGDATHKASVSSSASVETAVTAPADFQVSVAPATASVTAGYAGNAVVTVTPENNASLTGPMFVTLSCSGLPDQASCTFTPGNAQILSTTPATCAAGAASSECPPTSTMVVLTSAASTTTSFSPASRPGKSSTPIAWAFLAPGVLGLGGIAWGARRKRWLKHVSLVALVALITLMGTTACNPRYNYEHHGPVANPGTPAGTYTITVTGQSSDGVTATTHNTSFVLTVK
jgi:hypothetical protein